MPRRALEWSDPSRPPTPRDDHTGRVLADRYRLEGVLAQTTTSTIYRAHDSRGSAPVAVKLLHPEIHVDPARVERFKREAKFLANLRHTHLADFIDTDSTPEGLLYIVTALIDGRPLVEWCSGDARLDAETVCRIGVQVAEGLAYMHRAGVLHRDVKASNII
ncbi:protein kinase domain-containing protein [Nannocystis bainbridge]|uniref:Protein kinase n=1 Tax=Nannocystis bainbridge TaxID=2995303 RepID=A0ABT5E241_9BACT|nr:protein kinase [Nannocystis bainbridge]MDC0719939.1 protein kinase [Nannocystis bainbridge]